MRSETMLHMAPDHPAFAGHFPGAPIVPGVVLLDAAVHAALELLRSDQASERDPAGACLCSIGSAKFLSPVGPGETLTVCVDGTPAGSVRFEISCGTRKVASGTLVLSPRRD
ncbi:MAG: Beta-hydroxyacyl-(acyl-carrier-protein) dehydratase, FabA/FabZ [Ramlibacter sp.]|jgi:3-hydroxyacyl-[acyl-carrier-protein] dehydratase|nr:Beta-hydroxyacyl-(acyl-carrier-protein) dehydratase, FabA/FabZ [Ramlibacter sp.]